MSEVFSDDELRTIADCIDAIGTPDFPRLISDFCASLCDADNVYLIALFNDLTPVEIYGNHARATQKTLLNRYLDAAYLLDPFFLQYQKRLGDQVLTLDEIAPDDFKQSEYFAMFFRDMGLTDECGLILHFNEDAAVFISLGIERSDVRANSDRLKNAQPLIASITRRHWANLSPENTDGSGRLSAHLSTAFKNFGSSMLSPRECEVTHMILQGHSSKSIARVFDNSPETIKVHRKRIYTKLRVASQGELLSLFLNALRRMPATATGDPLAYLDTSPT